MHVFEIRGTLNRIGIAVSSLAAVMVPVSVRAGTIDLSDVRITARSTFSSQRVMPEKSDFDVKVAPPDELLQAARANLASASARGTLAVRINGVRTAWWRDDLAAAAHADVIVVPKVESADEVAAVARNSRSRTLSKAIRVLSQEGKPSGTVDMG
jgi:hypothetical protein